MKVRDIFRQISPILGRPNKPAAPHAASRQITQSNHERHAVMLYMEKSMIDCLSTFRGYTFFFLPLHFYSTGILKFLIIWASAIAQLLTKPLEFFP